VRIVVGALLVLSLACAYDPVVHVRYRPGQTVESVLVDLSTQREQLYVDVRDASALRHRLASDVSGDLRMSVFVAQFSHSADLTMEYRPYEPLSPRGTLVVGSSGRVRGTYAVISRGRVMRGER